MGNVELNYCFNCMEPLPAGQQVCSVCGHDNSIPENAENVLPEGTILNGKYLIGKVLGQGGFGVTYLGFDLTLQIRVAIKEYFPVGLGVRASHSPKVTPILSSANSKGFEKGCEEFQSEARTLARFNSPNIVHVRDYFRENGTSYIVMDYVEGNNLSQEVEENGKMPWERVLSLFKPLILELDKLHQKKLIHRDIKPDNLKISKDEFGRESLVLLDFGAARRFVSEKITKTYTAMVSPGYAPFEQYAQKSHQGPFTDVYAICATMYYAITGTTPAAAPDRLTGDAEILPLRVLGYDIPQKIDAALMHGLEVKSADRTPAMQELYEELTEDPVSEVVVNDIPEKVEQDFPVEIPDSVIISEKIEPTDNNLNEQVEDNSAEINNKQNKVRETDFVSIIRQNIKTQLGIVAAIALAVIFIILLIAGNSGKDKDAAATQTVIAEAELILTSQMETAIHNAAETRLAEIEKANLEATPGPSGIPPYFQETQIAQTMTQSAIYGQETAAYEAFNTEQTQTAEVMIATQVMQTVQMQMEQTRTAQAQQQTATQLNIYAEQTSTQAEVYTEQTQTAEILAMQAMQTAQAQQTATQAAIYTEQTATQAAVYTEQTQTAQAQQTATQAAIYTEQTATQAMVYAEQTQTAQAQQTATQAVIYMEQTATQAMVYAEQTQTAQAQQTATQAMIYSEQTATQAAVYMEQAQTAQAQQTATQAAIYTEQTATQAAVYAEQTQTAQAQQTATQAAIYTEQTATQAAVYMELTQTTQAQQTATQAAIYMEQTATQAAVYAEQTQTAQTQQTATQSAIYTEQTATQATVYMEQTQTAQSLQTATQAAIYAAQTKEAVPTATILLPTATPSPQPTAAPTASGSILLSDLPFDPETLSVGDIVTYGKFEQDNNYKNGAEPIEWQVLAIENNRALLISKYGLDGRSYNHSRYGVTPVWEYSELRSWLNKDFYRTVFNDSEKSRIPLVTVKNSDNAVYKTAGGNDTQDRIFLLSIEEASKYFAYDAARQCRPTLYATTKWSDLYRVSEPMFWWLRSPGGWTGTEIAIVKASGQIDSFGIAKDRKVGVRPVLWLDLSMTSTTDEAQESMEITEDNSALSSVSAEQSPTATVILLEATQTKEAEPTATIPLPTATPTPQPTVASTSAGNISFSNLSFDPETLHVGDIVTYGHYEQDNYFQNGHEPIEWQVLAVEDNRALMISTYGLDGRAYHHGNDGVKAAWENSEMRTWLNSNFYNMAFTSSEKSKISLVTIENPDNAVYKTTGGNKTEDRIFLLSIDEAEKYFSYDTARQCLPTMYAMTKWSDVYRMSQPMIWWLRSPGGWTGTEIAIVKASGQIDSFGFAESAPVGVRPAFWLDLSWL